ncbi:hypothetical protein APED_26440 [Acanthopleuribacter pedis]
MVWKRRLLPSKFDTSESPSVRMRWLQILQSNGFFVRRSCSVRNWANLWNEKKVIRYPEPTERFGSPPDASHSRTEPYFR